MSVADLYSEVDGRWLCNACNVRPGWLGEHRCFGSDGGGKCECSDPLCRLHRGETTLAELEREAVR